MGRLLKALAAGARATFQGVARAFEPSRYTVAGLPVRCPHCGSVTFELRHPPFFRLDWTNRQAALLVCSCCSSVQWFTQQPERVD